MQTGPSKIIIEGTNYANTKKIALALSKYPQFIGQQENHRYTTVISAEWGNFRDFPWGKDLIGFDPNEKLQAMSNYSVWVRLIELQGIYNWIIDRFHITTKRYQWIMNKNECDFFWLEERLLKQGFHIVHMVQNEDELRQEIESRECNNIENEFSGAIREQKLSQEIVSASILPTFELDISGLSVQDIVKIITEWYEEVYSYTQPENQQPEKIFLPSCC